LTSKPSPGLVLLPTHRTVEPVLEDTPCVNIPVSHAPRVLWNQAHRRLDDAACHRERPNRGHEAARGITGEGGTSPWLPCLILTGGLAFTRRAESRRRSACGGMTKIRLRRSNVFLWVEAKSPISRRPLNVYDIWSLFALTLSSSASSICLRVACSRRFRGPSIATLKQ
jgi:hypothetical protein